MECQDSSDLPIFSTNIPDTPDEYLQAVSHRMKFENQWIYLQYTSQLSQIRNFLKSNNNLEERLNWIRDNASVVDQCLRCSCHHSAFNVDLQYAKGTTKIKITTVVKIILISGNEWNSYVVNIAQIQTPNRLNRQDHITDILSKNRQTTTTTNSNAAITKLQIDVASHLSFTAKNTANTNKPQALAVISDNWHEKYTIDNDLSVTILNYGAYQDGYSCVPLDVFLHYVPGVTKTRNGLLLQYTTYKGNIIYICRRRLYLGGPRSVKEAKEEHEWFAAYVNYNLKKRQLPYQLNISVCEKATSINANFVYKQMVPMKEFELNLREIWQPKQVFLKHRPDRQIFCHFVYNLEVDWKKSRRVALLISYQRQKQYMFLQLKGIEYEYQIPLLLQPILDALRKTFLKCIQ